MNIYITNSATVPAILTNKTVQTVTIDILRYHEFISLNVKTKTCSETNHICVQPSLLIQSVNTADKDKDMLFSPIMIIFIFHKEANTDETLCGGCIKVGSKKCWCFLGL